MQHLLQNEQGVTALEYGLLAALIAASITLAITTLGLQIQQVLSSLATVLNSAS